MTVLQNRDWQVPSIYRLDANGLPVVQNNKLVAAQWSSYVPPTNKGGTTSVVTASGTFPGWPIVLGSPGTLPPGHTKAAMFQSHNTSDRPRLMAKDPRGQGTDADPDGPGADGIEGQERWRLVGWVLFPADFAHSDNATGGGSTVIWAYHNDSSEGPGKPNIQFTVKRERPYGAPLSAARQPETLYVRMCGGRQWDTQSQGAFAGGWVPEGKAVGPRPDGSIVWHECDRDYPLFEVQRDRWYHIVEHCRWHHTMGQAIYEVYVDGVLTASSLDRPWDWPKTGAGFNGVPWTWKTTPDNTGANLYDLGAGAQDVFPEIGIYMPTEGGSAYRAEAQSRKVWITGTLIADDPADVEYPSNETPKVNYAPETDQARPFTWEKRFPALVKELGQVIGVASADLTFPAKGRAITAVTTTQATAQPVTRRRRYTLTTITAAATARGVTAAHRRGLARVTVGELAFSITSQESTTMLPTYVTVHDRSRISLTVRDRPGS